MARAPAKVKPFATEAELCARFLGAIGDGWTPYPETEGWDILLVRKSDGLQIGIEAKLRLNAAVIAQALEDGFSYVATRPGPDCRAVLVPHDDAGAYDRIAAYIGFTIIRVFGTKQASSDVFFRPPLPKEVGHWHNSDWYECAPAKRHALPEYVPDVAAGAPAPLQLTRWKIAAIKIAVTLEQRGFVTRHDFKHIGLDHRRWIAAESGWLKVSDGRYLAGDGLPNFKLQHPRVYAEIAADADKWMGPAIISANQKAML